jgi:hypothetical protein
MAALCVQNAAGFSALMQSCASIAECHLPKEPRRNLRHKLLYSSPASPTNQYRGDPVDWLRLA